MPVKERYWKNPEKHRKESFDRRRKWIALGISHFLRLSPAAQSKALLYKNNWRKAHLDKSNAGSTKYRNKLKRLFGVCGARSIWRHTMLKAAADIKNRKAALAAYGRKQTTAPLLPR